jgi:uncharacterized tellurite resistance protein B-like protein
MASDEFLIRAAEILLGAAHADGEMDGIEEDALIELLEDALVEDGELPDEIHEVIEDFDPDEFDLEAAAESIADEPDDHRRALLVMVATLRDANGEVDRAEDLFYVRLAEALDLETDLDEFDPDDLGFSPDEDGDPDDDDSFLEEDGFEIGPGEP